MDREQFLQQLFPLIGGKDNTSLCEFQRDSLYVTLKDAGLAEEDAVQNLPGVVSAQLRRSRLTIRFKAPTKCEEAAVMAKTNANADYRALAKAIIENIGGKSNITFAAHCMTRLRLNLQDESKFDTDKVKAIPGVINVNKVGQQFQIIIGPGVEKVYDAFCAETGLTPEAAIDENPDTKPQKEPITVKKVFGAILDYLSVSMFSVAPVLMAGGLFRCITVIFGPNMLNLMAADSNLYVALTAVYNASFYFLPLFVGYTAAKKLGMTPILGMLVGAILIEPSLLALAGGENPAFSVYGVPCTLFDYSSTIMPALLSVWFVSLIEKFFKKALPQVLQTSFTPFLTFVVSLPFVLCFFAPIGNYLGNLICDAIMAFYNTFGLVALVLMCTFSLVLTISGMHVALGTLSAVQLLTTAYDPFFFVAGIASNFTIMGMCLASALKLKNKSARAEAAGYFVASSLGGVTEPGLYGLAMKYKTPFVGLFAGGAAAGLYAGLTSTACHMLPPASNFLSCLAMFGDTTASVINAVITCAIAFVISCVVTYFFGYPKKTLDQIEK